MSVIASERSNSAYSFDDSGSGVSHISEELFQKQMGETEFKPPLDLEELYLKIQARVPGQCVEVLQTLRAYYSNDQIFDIMLDSERLLKVVNDILEDFEGGSNSIEEEPNFKQAPRSPRKSERYRVCNPNPLDAPISNPVQNISKTTPIPMPVGQPNYFNFQPQSNVQNPVYYRHPQQQPVYKVVYPQYYYVAQPQMQPQFVYGTQPYQTNQVYQNRGYGYPRYC